MPGAGHVRWPRSGGDRHEASWSDRGAGRAVVPARRGGDGRPGPRPWPQMAARAGRKRYPDWILRVRCPASRSGRQGVLQGTQGLERNHHLVGHWLGPDLGHEPGNRKDHRRERAWVFESHRVFGRLRPSDDEGTHRVYPPSRRCGALRATPAERHHGPGDANLQSRRDPYLVVAARPRPGGHLRRVELRETPYNNGQLQQYWRSIRLNTTLAYKAKPRCPALSPVWKAGFWPPSRGGSVQTCWCRLWVSAATPRTT